MQKLIQQNILDESARLLSIFTCLLVSACSALPSAFDDASIKDISYAQVSEDTENYKNTRVRWSGVVIEVKEKKSGNLMQILFYPLEFYGRPDIGKPSEGYFLVKSTQAFDPKIFFAGREIVVVGVIEGTFESTVESKRTKLPLIKTTAVYPWPVAYRDNYYRHCPTCYFKQLFW